MLYLNVLFHVAVLALSQSSTLVTFPVSFSYAPKAYDAFQLSSLDSVQHVLRDFTQKTFHRLALRVWRDDNGELANSTLDDALNCTWVSSKAVPWGIRMKYRGSRTTYHGDGPTPNRTVSYHRPTIDLATSLRLWKWLAVVGLCGAIALIGSPREFLPAIECIGRAWLGFSSDVEACALVIFGWVLGVSRDLFYLIDSSLCTISVQIVIICCYASTCIERFLEQQRIRLQKERNLASIQRKTEAPHPPTFLRPYGRHIRKPIFERGAQEKLTFLYLPEEERTRHMVNPRHFSRVKRVGTGAFGEVYQVENRITGNLLAMKMMSMAHTMQEDLAWEMRALLRLQGGVWYPRVLSTFMSEKHFYIFMPFYRRGDLHAFMELCGGCLPRASATFYLAELLVAIQGLHRRGIIHRDLKPENILLTNDGHLVIADFGVAHVFYAEEDGEDEDEDEFMENTFMEDEFPLWCALKRGGGDDFPLLTASVDNPDTTTGYSGTQIYSAPEVHRLEEYSYGVDYYAMAIIYHEMVTGDIPFQLLDPVPGSSEPLKILDLDHKGTHHQPLSMSDRKFLVKMLDEDPFARPSVKQMKGDLVFASIDWAKIEKREEPCPRLLARRKRVSIHDALERCLTSVG
ncbi:kinase-like protein [Pholiota conissans]|uniref:Kinase-like protein n=1 Tax=Pholiota conissans TaxID=109636 RepID=A0A9P5Z259_9AGAR|nr:kinase-like protein [Pholiota conissans]